MTENKPTQTVDDYISTFPADTQQILQKIRRIIHKTVQGAEEKISYGIPTFTLNGKSVVYFSGWKQHVSIHPRPAGDEAYQKAVAPYGGGKGTTQFPLDKPIPYDLVERTVRFLAEERATRSGY